MYYPEIANIMKHRTMQHLFGATIKMLAETTAFVSIIQT